MNPTDLAHDLFSAHQRVAEAIEVADGHVQRHADETWLVERLTLRLTLLIAIDGSCTADDCRGILNGAGIPATGTAGQRIRRRVISTTINRGRKAGLWKPDGWTQGVAGRPIMRWVKP